MGIGKLMDNYGTIYVGLANGGLLALPRLLFALPQTNKNGLKSDKQPRPSAPLKPISPVGNGLNCGVARTYVAWWCFVTLVFNEISPRLELHITHITVRTM